MAGQAVLGVLDVEAALVASDCLGNRGARFGLCFLDWNSLESDEPCPAGLFELWQDLTLAFGAEQRLVLDFGLKFEAAIALGASVLYALHTLCMP